MVDKGVMIVIIIIIICVCLCCCGSLSAGGYYLWTKGNTTTVSNSAATIAAAAAAKAAADAKAAAGNAAPTTGNTAPTAGNAAPTAGNAAPTPTPITASVPSQLSWVYLSNTFLSSGYDIFVPSASNTSQYTNLSSANAATCQNLCSSYANCMGFTVDSTNKCWIKNSIDLVNTQDVGTGAVAVPASGWTAAYLQSSYAFPTMTSASSNSYLISASSSASNGAPWYAFDKSPSCWIPTKSYTVAGAYTGSAGATVDGVWVSGEWLQLQSPSALRVVNYNITSVASSSSCTNSACGFEPYNWNLAASTNGASWTSISKGNNTSASWNPFTDNSDGASVTCPFMTPTSNSYYTYFRLLITSVYPGTQQTSYLPSGAMYNQSLFAGAPYIREVNINALSK